MINLPPDYGTIGVVGDAMKYSWRVGNTVFHETPPWSPHDDGQSARTVQVSVNLFKFLVHFQDFPVVSENPHFFFIRVIGSGGRWILSEGEKNEEKCVQSLKLVCIT